MSEKVQVVSSTAGLTESKLIAPILRREFPTWPIKISMQLAIGIAAENQGDYVRAMQRLDQAIQIEQELLQK